MLPTNQKAKEGMIYLKPKVGIFNKTSSENHNNNVYDWNPQHLYIISDDEIKENDWCTNTGGEIKDSFPFKVTKEVMNNKFIKKIIATTDKSITIPGYNSFDEDDIVNCYLPQPSQQFIEKYIEEYNKGNVIIDVLVEYNYELSCDEDEHGNLIPELYLKINTKDNTITIKKVKDNYSQKEVNELFEKYDFEIKRLGVLDEYKHNYLEIWKKENL